MTPREWRKNNGYDIKTLAEKLKVSRSYISLLERGERQPSYKVLKDYHTISGGAVTFDSFNAINNTSQDNSHKHL